MKKKCYYFFLNKFQSKSDFKSFLWENEARSSHFLLHIRFPYFFSTYHILFFVEKRMYIEIQPHEMMLLYPTSLSIYIFICLLKPRLAADWNITHSDLEILHHLINSIKLRLRTQLASDRRGFWYISNICLARRS